MAATPAEAACVSPVDGETTCNGGSGANICSAGSGTWECDTTLGGGTAPVEAYIVLDDTGDWCTAGNYCAFGLDTAGDGFCCEHAPVSPVTIYEIHLYGGVSGDTLAFQYDDGSASHQLENGAAVAIQAYMWGDDGNDTMDGSDYWDATYFRYHEALDGGYDIDTLYGYGGMDGLTGDWGNDTCYGGALGDYLGGSWGDDILSGGGGTDYMFGEFNDDMLHGGAGADDIRGGDDEDNLCGGFDAFADALYGDDAEDWLWGAGAGDTETGGLPPVSPGDRCSFGGAAYGCETTITSPPTCPS